jgi:hypothetical protein
MPYQARRDHCGESAEHGLVTEALSIWAEAGVALRAPPPVAPLNHAVEEQLSIAGPLHQHDVAHRTHTPHARRHHYIAIVNRRRHRVSRDNQQPQTSDLKREDQAQHTCSRPTNTNHCVLLRASKVNTAVTDESAPVVAPAGRVKVKV